MDLNTLAIRNLSLEIAQFLYALLVKADMFLFPLLVSASASVTEQYGDRKCLTIRVVSSAAKWQSILAGGAYDWWSNIAQENDEALR